ncbi:hypothetical protein SRHO_G00029980 [Serrasalmus rhombeus]
MLGNAAAFVKHLRAFHSEMAGLSPSQFDQIGLQFKRLRRDNARRIRSHQQEIRREKSSEFPHLCATYRSRTPAGYHISLPFSELLRPGSDLTAFLRVARGRVPRLLAELQTRSSSRSLRLLHGYISGYLAIVSGHRPVVFLNLWKSHLDQADVDKHKTDRAYGGACLALDDREVSWLHRLYEVSAQSGGDRCDCVPILRKTTLEYNQRTASSVGKRSGRVTFRLIRTTIANQAKRNLSARDRKLVCEAMRHGVSTADRFYTAVPGVRDMFRIRELRTNALECDGVEPETVDTDSGDHQTSGQ